MKVAASPLWVTELIVAVRAITAVIKNRFDPVLLLTVVEIMAPTLAQLMFESTTLGAANPDRHQASSRGKIKSCFFISLSVCCIRKTKGPLRRPDETSLFTTGQTRNRLESVASAQTFNQRLKLRLLPADTSH